MPSWIGPWEIAIVVVLILLIFGPRKLPELGSSLGKSIRGFRKGLKETQDEVKTAVADVREATDIRSTEAATTEAAAAPAATAAAVAAPAEAVAAPQAPAAEAAANVEAPAENLVAEAAEVAEAASVAEQTDETMNAG